MIRSTLAVHCSKVRFFPCRTIGEPVTRLLLTASVKEDVDEATAMVNGGQTVANLPATGTARFAWQALQSYLVTAPSGHQMKSTGTLFQYNLNRSLSPLLDCWMTDLFPIPLQEKYKVMNPWLPVVVAESILTVDRHMELPLWLVDIFKASRLYFGLLSALVSFPSTNPPVVRETGDIARRSKQPVPNSNTWW